jgi:uncharacterized repeat protein (TIGR03803 family)
VNRAAGAKEGNLSKFNWGMRAGGVFLLWSTAAVVLRPQTTAVAPTVTFTTLYSFDGTDGDEPNAGMVQAANGDLYGTTYAGGNGEKGTVFRITPNGALTTLHNFDGTDGSLPLAGLIQAPNGDFYGTTFDGGTNRNNGAIYKITAGGALTTLHSFRTTDGANPTAGLVQTPNGGFYGTTFDGGAPSSDGTVFKITPAGALTTLHSFQGPDGKLVRAGLVQGKDGNFYGTTESGGSSGDGTVFSITPGGTLTTLHSFEGADGQAPIAGLVQDGNGNFYGTTYAGGPTGDGTIFMITPAGSLTTLYAFCSQSNCTDGASPFAGLIQGTDGNLYGTTRYGGANRQGAIFKITTSGAFAMLHSFCLQNNCTDGANPLAGLVQDTNGIFYGTTAYGGANGDGTVFSLSVGLGPFVKTNPTSGKVGKAVKILGTNLTGSTSVTFNGTAATFTVKSKSEITTTVPTGATTGTVQVVTPGGTLSSNVPFRVTP